MLSVWICRWNRLALGQSVPTFFCDANRGCVIFFTSVFARTIFSYISARSTTIYRLHSAFDLEVENNVSLTYAKTMFKLTSTSRIVASLIGEEQSSASPWLHEYARNVCGQLLWMLTVLCNPPLTRKCLEGPHNVNPRCNIGHKRVDVIYNEVLQSCICYFRANEVWRN